MAPYQKFNQFVEDRNHGVHDLSSDQLIVLVTNTAPQATDAVAADITEIAYTNLTTFDSDDVTEAETNRIITRVSSGQTGGVYNLVLKDIVLKASGGAVGPLRYFLIANSTAPGTPLIAFYDRGSEVTLQNKDSITLNFDDANGLFQDS